MAPVSISDPSGLEATIKANKVIVFAKTTCPFCAKVKSLFSDLNIAVTYVELDELSNGPAVQDLLLEKSGQKTVPNVFINGRHVGGFDDTFSASKSGLLSGLLTLDEDHGFEYDLVVIGGGSGGLAASKEAARLGRKVAVLDFVTPTPVGTTWGLGGTCVNVGCIPKKLMHQAALLGGARKDAMAFGWPSQDGEAKVDWTKMVEGIQSHIGSLNWGYKVALRDKKVKYLNEYGSFVDSHTLKTVNKKGKEGKITANNFIVATGGRPKYPDIPGAREYGITSDDIFSLPYNPGKTLFIGASYISLECAGFVQGIGIGPVTVMVRSILLRGFDQQMANKVGAYMEEEGVNFVRECVPTKMELVEEGKPGKIKVYGKYNDGTEYVDWFNTVCFAIGRDAETKNIGLDKAGVKVNERNGKIPADATEQTNVSNIFAIGDVLDGRPELTPVAIQAGINLARRLAKVSDVKTDYENVATTVFTPIEYGCIGLSEEDAYQKFGESNVEVYHKNFLPLEWSVPKRSEKVCYIKLICRKDQDEKVIGLHYLGPNAGEVTQGYGLAFTLGAKKSDFDRLIGIHPTNAEWFTTLEITKRSGVSPEASGC